MTKAFKQRTNRFPKRNKRKQRSDTETSDILMSGSQAEEREFDEDEDEGSRKKVRWDSQAALTDGSKDGTSWDDETSQMDAVDEKVIICLSIGCPACLPAFTRYP
jgi:hypothetical protein